MPVGERDVHSDPEALELLALVSKQPWRDQIQSLDVSKYPRTKQLEVVTTRGGRIVWGGRPSAPLPGETSTREKLDKLTWLNRQYKSIDGGRSWTSITNGLPAEQMLFVVREDPVDPNILYVGGENGVFISRDAGVCGNEAL